MKSFHRIACIFRAESPGQEIRPFHVLNQSPVEEISRSRSGIQENIVGRTSDGIGNIGGRPDAKRLNNRFTGESTEPPDIILVFAAVKLCNIDNSPVQKTGYIFRFFIGKDTCSADSGIQEFLQSLRLFPADAASASRREYEADIIRFQLVCSQDRRDRRI